MVQNVKFQASFLKKTFVLYLTKILLLLFNIFFAAVLNVVLQRFSEEPVILAELVHVKEPSASMGPEPAVDYVRRAVWGMPYADDACIVSRSPQGLAKMMEVIMEVCRAFA